MSIAILVSYALVMYLFSGEFALVVRQFKSGGTESEFKESHNRGYMMFNLLAHIMGVLSLSVAFTKLFCVKMPESGLQFLPQWFLPMTCLAVGALVVAVMYYQRLLLKLSGLLTLGSEFVSSLLHRKSAHFTLASVIIAPVLLLYSGFRRGWDEVFLYVSVILAIIFLFNFLYRTCTLFVGQKISILYWFLYLCIVELFPISLVAAVLMRII